MLTSEVANEGPRISSFSNTLLRQVECIEDVSSKSPIY